MAWLLFKMTRLLFKRTQWLFKMTHLLFKMTRLLLKITRLLLKLLFTFLSDFQLLYTSPFRSDSNSQSCNIRQKMNTLRDAWFENPDKKVFWEKSHFMKNPVYFFLFSISQEKVWHKSCSKSFKLLFQFFFILMKSEKLKR